MEDEIVIKTFFNDFKELTRINDSEGMKLNLIPLYYNRNKNKGVCTKIKKGLENQKYNEQDYPIILKYPGVMKIEQIYARTIKSNVYYLLIMEESLSNFKVFNKTLHGEEGYALIKINNSPFNDIIGDNLLKYFIRQLIHLLEFVDRNNLCIKDLSLNKFFISKKDFLLRLYNFKDIINLDDKEKSIDKKSTKKSSSINTKIKNNTDEFEIEKKTHYFQIGKCIYDLIFGNHFFRNENEKPDLFEDKKVDLLLRYIKKIKAKNIDENLKELLIQLLGFEPKYRPNIEEIYRNKWIYQDYHIINDIISNFERDIVKIISEFAKNDYLKKLENCQINKSRKKNNNNDNIIINNKNDKKNKCIKTGRFTFKKRNKKI